MIRDDPQEYVRDLAGSYPKKKKNEVKPKMNEEYENTRLCAAKLLQTICENVDGLITFVGVLANELID